MPRTFHVISRPFVWYYKAWLVVVKWYIAHQATLGLLDRRLQKPIVKKQRKLRASLSPVIRKWNYLLLQKENAC